MPSAYEGADIISFAKARESNLSSKPPKTREYVGSPLKMDLELFVPSTA